MDEITFCSLKDYSVVNGLSAVLRDIAYSRNGRNQLTLSASCLQVLYEGFRHIHNSSCVTLSHTDQEQKLCKSLAYLYETVQNIKDLKIFESGETLQGHVNCTDFTSISQLEVKCLPLYQLYGLSKVAPNLVIVSCIGCITRVQELFEQCGADTFRASEAMWAKLTEVHLSYNNLQMLDNSLRLVTNLKHVDLSHNNLCATDSYLLALNNLEILNLSYNSLKVFPEISPTAKCHLTTLNLRNNLLTSLEGLERLFCLRSLDVSNNLLVTVKALNSLKSLLLLQCLVTSGNPLSFHPSYRQTVISCLHPAAVSQVNFDGQRLNKKEKVQFYQNRPVNSVVTVQPPVALDLSESIDSLSVDSLPDSQRRSRRRRRPRLVKIANQDDTGEYDAFEDSFNLSDSTAVYSTQSSIRRERDLTGSERYDSGLVTPRLLSSSSSRTRSKTSLKHSCSAYPIRTSDDMRSNIEISGNRLCLVNHEEDDSAASSSKAQNIRTSRTLDNLICDTEEINAQETLESGRTSSSSVENPVKSVAVTRDSTVNTDDSSVIKHNNDVIIRDSPAIVRDSPVITRDASAAVPAASFCFGSYTSQENVEPSKDDGDRFGNADFNTGSPLVSMENNISGPLSSTPVDSDMTSGKMNGNVTENLPDFFHLTQLPSDKVKSFVSRSLVHSSKSFSSAVSMTDSMTDYNRVSGYADKRSGRRDTVESIESVPSYQDVTSDQSSFDVGSLPAENVTLDSLIENGFEGDFLIYLLGSSRDKSFNDKFIVSVIDNWLYIRNASDVVERLDLRGLRAVHKVADQLSEFIAKRGLDVPTDERFPGPVVRILFDAVRKDMRERLLSMKDENQAKQLAGYLKPFLKAKASKKMQCLRCDCHFDEADAITASEETPELNMYSTSYFKENKASVALRCPKCDSQFVIESADRESAQRPVFTKSQTLSRLDEPLSSGKSKDSGQQKRLKKQKRSTMTPLSSSVAASAARPVLSNASLFSRRRTSERISVGDQALNPLDSDPTVRGIPDSPTAIDVVQFYMEPSDDQ